MSTTLPRNDELADQLELLADLSELEGEDSFRVLAYRRAATRIRETGAPVAQLALDGKAKELSGIGKTIEDKIVQVVEKGEMEALTKRKALVPEEVVKFMRLPGLGPKTARRIWKELGVTTIAGLKEAAEQEKLRVLTGLGAKSEEKILKALAEEPKDPRESRRLLGDGLPVLLELVEELRAHPAAVKVSEAGSARRRRETFRDLDVIATSTDPPALIEAFTSRDNVADVIAKGETKATVLTNEGLRLDLRVVPPESYGNLLQHFTGSKEHNVALREDAVRRGFSVSEYSVTNTETGEEFTAADEEELYAHLGYAYIPPELRENGGELAAARNGELPKLVERGDLRGDLHSHSTWSDGKASIQEMALAAQALGHEYLAMCDHSQRLRDGRLQHQWEEIDALNERLAPFRILKGIEVNIRANGELDVTDDLLAPLDWVMASVHTSFDKDPTERVAERDAEPARRLHRPPDEPADRRSQPVGDRGREGRRGRARDRHLPRDQLAARPARPPRRERPARRRGGPDADDLERRPLDEGAPLRRARRRPGAPRLADEGADPEHADVAGDREAAQMSFRDDGAAAVDWVASYLERVGELPVLAQVEPGELRSRLPPSPPETRGAVRGDPARPGRGAAPGCDALAEPALLRLLREHRVGAGDPRRAARRGVEPGRDPLAHIAAAAGAGGGDARLARAAARAARRAARPSRGHCVDGDDGGARRGARRAAGRARRRLLGARALLGREGVPDPRPRGAHDAGRRRLPAPSRRARPYGRVRRRRHDRDDVDELDRPCAGDRGRSAGGRASGSTSMPPTPAPRRSAPSCATRSRAGSAPTPSSSIRTSGC